VVAVERNGLRVRELLEGDGPVGAPHEACGAEGLAEAFDLGNGVGVGVGLRGQRPEVGDFHEDSGVTRECEQEIEFVGLAERAVCHVIDDDGEVRVLLDERDEIGHACDWGEDRHRDLELGTSTPEGWHEWAANPVVCGGRGGAETHAMEAVDFGEAAEVVGSGWVLRIDSADAVKGARVAFEDAGEVAIIPTVVTHMDDDGAKDLIDVHEFEELFDGGIFRRRGGSRGEGKGGVVFPYVNVGVDEW